MRHDVARRVQFGTALVHSKYGITASQWICRALARDAGKANSYQLMGCRTACDSINACDRRYDKKKFYFGFRSLLGSSTVPSA